MNICFFSIVTYWHGVKGGMEIHNKHLIQGLANRGHVIYVISTRHPSGTTHQCFGNIHLYYLTETKFGSVRNGWREQSKKKFLELNRTHNFDVICSQSPVFPIIPKNIRSVTPVLTFIQAHECWVMISEINQFLSFENNLKDLFINFLSFLYRYLGWELFNFFQSDIIVSPAHEVSRSLKRCYFIRPHKIRTIYNGVDESRFKPDKSSKNEIIKLYPKLAGKRIILFLSHVTRHKGLHLLIKIFPQLLHYENNLVLFVVGAGNYLKEAKKDVTKLGLHKNVIFTGMIDIHSIPDYINASDIFVLPTLRKEGLPFSVLEAMACQKPIVTTHIGGNPTAIKNGITGLMVFPMDSDDLFFNVLLILKNRSLSDRLAKNAYNSFNKNFQLSKMIDNFEDLIKKQTNMKS